MKAILISMIVIQKFYMMWLKIIILERKEEKAIVVSDWVFGNSSKVKMAMNLTLRKIKIAKNKMLFQILENQKSLYHYMRYVK